VGNFRIEMWQKGGRAIMDSAEIRKRQDRTLIEKTKNLSTSEGDY